MSDHEPVSIVPVADSDDLLRLATDVAAEAARLVVDRRPPTGVEVSATKSSPTDIVTEMDTAAERLIRERLLGARPDDGFLGEEGGLRRGTSGLVWVVDPIDGTVNYLYGIPQYAVSIAAEVDGVVQVGVVTNPATGQTWSAVRGKGAWLDGEPIQVGQTDELGQALLATGFGYDAGVRARQAAAVARLLPRLRDIRRFGAASLDLCAVATGWVDAFAEEGLNPWDIAAGGLVAREAGALVTDLTGGPADASLTVAAGPSLHARLLDLLAESGFGSG